MASDDRAKKAKEDALKARIAARKAEADKKAKEAAQKRAEREEQARRRWPVTRQLRAKLFKGAVIVNVTNIVQALLAQEVGATAISAYDKAVTATMMANHAVRMASPEAIRRYIDELMIPVITSVRIGHLMEAKVMERIGVNMIDEGGLTKAASVLPYFTKRDIGIPTICAVTSFKDCLLRIQEGALILRIAGARDGGDVQDAFKTLIAIQTNIQEMRFESKYNIYATDSEVYRPLLDNVRDSGRLPVLLFGSGGIHTPSDVATMMKNGCDGVFIDNNVFQSPDPEAHLKSILQAAKEFDNVEKICELSTKFA
ncbi:hypothetical protein GGI00_001732 [Coemansia sp. RSA 2681]|nr:hypothetical protein GGI00_001732 [Coemansia sp. RSA 2681]